MHGVCLLLLEWDGTYEDARISLSCKLGEEFCSRSESCGDGAENLKLTLQPCPQFAWAHDNWQSSALVFVFIFLGLIDLLCLITQPAEEQTHNILMA